MRFTTKSLMALALAGPFSHIALAQDATWLGDFADSWLDPNQWDPAVVPDGAGYNWIVGNGLTITTGQADAGGLNLFGGGIVVGSGGSLTIDGLTSGGVLGLNSDLAIYNGGLIEFKNIGLDPADAEFGGPAGTLDIDGGTLRIGPNTELTQLDAFGFVVGPRIAVNNGRLEFVNATPNDTAGLGLVYNIGANATVAIDLANPTDTIDLNEPTRLYNSNGGLIELGNGTFNLNYIHGRVSAGSGATILNRIDGPNDDILVSTFDELIMDGGTVSVAGSGFHQFRVNGTVRGAGEILLDANSEFLSNLNSQLIADDSSGTLAMRGQADGPPQIGFGAGQAIATDGGTLVFDTVSTLNNGFAQVTADGGTVWIRNTSYFGANEFSAINTGRLVVGFGSVARGLLTVNNGGRVEVEAGAVFELLLDNNFYAINDTGVVDVAGVLQVQDTYATLYNRGTIAMRIGPAGVGGVLRLRGDTELTGPGVLDLGRRVDTPIVTEPTTSLITLTHGDGHTIRGGGVFELTPNAGVQWVNQGLIEAAELYPLVFRGDQFLANDRAFFNLQSTGKLSVAEDGTMRFERYRVSSTTSRGDIEVAGTLELHDSSLVINEFILNDGAVVNLTGTTGSIYANRWTSSGSVNVWVNGPDNDEGSALEPNIALRDGTVLSAGTNLRMSSGLLGVNGFGGPITNNGTIYIFNTANSTGQLAVHGTAEIFGTGTLFVDGRSRQPTIVVDNNDAPILKTTNTITGGTADMSGLSVELLAGGRILTSLQFPGGFKFEQLTMNPATSLHSFYRPVNELNIIVEQGALLHGGTLELSISPTYEHAGLRFNVIQAESGDVTGGFDDVIDRITRTTLTRGSLQYLIDY